MAVSTQRGQSGYESRTGAPDTFKFGGASGPVAAGTMLAVQPQQVNVVGEQRPSGVVAPQVGGYAPQLSGKIMDKINESLEKRQQEAFWKGMTDARQGAAIEEIEKEQPWYSRVFGSSYLEGAQFYTSQKMVVDWEIQTMKDMNELRKLDGAAIGPMLNETAQGFMTDSPNTNALIQQALIQRVPGLIETHAKARVAYENQQAIQAQAEYVGSTALAYQQQMETFAAMSGPDRETNKRLVLEATGNFLSSLVPPAGQNDESVTNFWKNTVTRAAQAGQFHVVNVMREAGYLDSLSIQDRKTLDDTLERYENKAVRKAQGTTEAMSLGIWGAKATTGSLSPVELVDEAGRLNADFAARTGIETPLINPNDLQNGIKSSATALIRAQEIANDRIYQQALKANTAREKEEAEVRGQLQVSQMYMSGQARTAEYLPGVGKDKVDFYGSILEQHQDPAVFQAMTIQNYNNGGYINRQVASSWQAQTYAAIGDDFNEEFQGAYDKWRSLYTARNGAGAAQAYYGDLHLKMQTYDSLVNGGVSQERAHRQAFGDPERWGKLPIDADQRKDAAAAVEKQLKEINPWLFSQHRLSDSSRAVVSQAISNRLAQILQNNPSLPMEAATKQAYDHAVDNGLEHLGSWAWQNPQGTAPFHQIAGLAQEDATELFNKVVAEKAKEVGIKGTFWKGNVPDNVPAVIYRWKDEPGMPARLRIDLFDDDGITRTINVTSDDLRNRRNQLAEKAREQPDMSGYGPLEYRNSWQGLHERRQQRTNPFIDWD